MSSEDAGAGGVGGAAAPAERCLYRLAVGACYDPVVAYVEAAGERWPICSAHTRPLAYALLEMGFDLELAGGQTRQELAPRLSRGVLEALERRKQRGLR
jgi:hypothetical protein